MNELVPFQSGGLREVFAAHVAAEGPVSAVTHGVTQQALRVGEGLGTHLHDSDEA